MTPLNHINTPTSKLPTHPINHNATTEKTLKVLYKEQRTKIEDIKKKTNYYNTRSLIERYDEGPGASGAGSPLRQRNVSGAPPGGSPQRGVQGQGQGQKMPSTPPRLGQGQGLRQDVLQTPMPLSPGLQTHLTRAYRDLVATSTRL